MIKTTLFAVSLTFSVAAYAADSPGDIITAPQGSVACYDLSTRQVTISASYDFSGVKSDLVFSDDGTKVYFPDIITAYGFGTYAVGELEGNRVRVRAGQHLYHQDPVYNYEENDCYLAIGNADGKYITETDEEYVDFIIDADGVISLPASKALLMVDKWGSVIGSNAGYSYRPVDLNSIVMPPENAQRIQYCMHYKTQLMGTDVYRPVNVVSENSKVYIQGVFAENMPQAWVCGEVEGDKVVFGSPALMGVVGNDFLGYFHAGGEPDWSSPVGYAFDDKLEFTYDRQTGAFETMGLMLCTLGDKILAESYDMPAFFPVTPHAAEPAKPEVLGFSDYRDGNPGFVVLRFSMYPIDNAGEYIDPERISWRLVADGEPYVFTPEKYSMQKEAKSRFAWGEQDGIDIVFEDYGIYNIWFYDPCATVRVECTYTYEGEDYTVLSEPFVLDPSGVENVCDKVVSVKYCTLDGLLLDSPRTGVNVRVTTYAGGMVKREKVMLK